MSEPRISSSAGLNPVAVPSSPPRTSARPVSSPRWRDIQFVEFETATETPLRLEPPRPELPPLAEPVAPTPVPPVAVAPFRIPANSNDPLPEPAPAAAEDGPFGAAKPVFPVELQPFPPEPVGDNPVSAAQPRGPRYGRAIAPLPPHLIASVKPPPRESLPPAHVRLRPTAQTVGKAAVLRGTPFGPRRGGRGWRGAVIGLICVAGAIVIARTDFVANLVERIGTRPHGDSAAAVREPPVLPVAVAPPQAAASTDPVPPPAPAAASTTPATAPTTPAPSSPAPSSPASDRLTDLTIKAKSGDTGAEYDLGVIFARGDGVAQDYAKAAGWFREAAINGNLPAQYNLGVLYEHGLGVPQNMNEALIWYHSAAARNYPSAQYNLAISYAQGHGTPQDLTAAARWYLRAAQQGVVAAMVNFAIQCEGGQGTDKSPTMAYAWYRAAGSRGDEGAAKRADELYRQFSESTQKAADMALGTAEDSIHEPLLPPGSGSGKSAAAAKPAQTPG